MINKRQFKSWFVKAKKQVLKYRAVYAFPRALFLIAIVIALSFLIRHSFLSGEIAQLEETIWFYLAGAGFTFLFLAGFISYYEYHGFGLQEGIVRSGGERPYVALTFDDGPSPRYTPAILDVLREKGVKATFFVVGKHVEKYPEIARKIVLDGHEIGNHTYSHRDLVPASQRTVLREINQAEQVIEKICRVKPSLFRPPRGLYSESVRQLVVEQGYTMVLWSVSTLDWSGLTACMILRRVKKYARNGSIILFHDSGALLKREGGLRDRTVKALSQVIDYLSSQNLQFVTVSQLLKDAGYVDSQELVGELNPLQP